MHGLSGISRVNVVNLADCQQAVYFRSSAQSLPYRITRSTTEEFPPNR